MPLVNIQILEGHPQERKDEIAPRVADTIPGHRQFLLGLG